MPHEYYKGHNNGWMGAWVGGWMFHVQFFLVQQYFSHMNDHEVLCVMKQLLDPERIFEPDLKIP